MWKSLFSQIWNQRRANVWIWAELMIVVVLLWYGIDLVYNYEGAACGRTLVRMDRILGRSDDMLIIRGVNVFPTQIESVILELPEFEPHYLLLVDRKNNTDTMSFLNHLR